MSKINKYLDLQLKSEFKKDAEDCIKIKNKLQDLEDHVWSSGWRILIDTIFEGFPSDNRRYKPSKIGYIFLNGIKDNPVPSLYQLLAETVGAESVEYEQICSIINDIKNGVETDKEEPIIKAKAILKQQSDIKLCIKAGICPKCGSPLKQYRIDNIHKWIDITECSKNPEHYKDSEYDCWDDD